MAQVKSGDEDKNRKITTRTDEKRTKRSTGWRWGRLHRGILCNCKTSFDTISSKTQQWPSCSELLPLFPPLQAFISWGYLLTDFSAFSAFQLAIKHFDCPCHNLSNTPDEELGDLCWRPNNYLPVLSYFLSLLLFEFSFPGNFCLLLYLLFQLFQLAIKHFDCPCHNLSKTPDQELGAFWLLQNSTIWKEAGTFLCQKQLFHVSRKWLIMI